MCHMLWYGAVCYIVLHCIEVIPSYVTCSVVQCCIVLHCIEVT